MMRWGVLGRLLRKLRKQLGVVSPPSPVAIKPERGWCEGCTHGSLIKIPAPVWGPTHVGGIVTPFHGGEK